MKIIRLAAISAACMLLFTGCVFSNTLRPENARSKALDKSTGPRPDISALEVNVPVGNLTVSYGSGQDIAVHAVLRANHGSTASGSEELLDLSALNFAQQDMNGGPVEVSVLNRKTHTDMWQWIKSNRPNTDFSADLQITVPQSIDSFALVTQVGNITLNEPHGVMTAQTDVGDVDVKSPSFSASSNNNLQTRVGNLTCAFTGAQAATGELSMFTGTGDVRVQTAAGTPLSKTPHKQVTGAAETIQFQSGFTITADTRVGDISVT